MTGALLWAGLLTMHAATGGQAMAARGKQVVTMEITQSDGFAEISIIGLTDDALSVRYALAVEGGSRTRHSGQSALAAGQRAVLSRVRISTERDWCARLSVEQSDGVHYVQQAGPGCAAPFAAS